MIDARMLSGPQILTIPDEEPERLFGKPDLVSDLYRELAKKWHPDHLGGDGAIFTHINVLHLAAKEHIRAGTWHIPGELTFVADGKTYALRYFKRFDFELGVAYLSQTKITYVVRKEFADLVEHACKVIKTFHFPDDATREVMIRYLPTISGCYETADSVVVMIDKPADLIRMRDLRDHCGGKMDPKHVAWMISRMLNHTSYFEWAKLTHNDLSLDTLFVCPEHHTVCILGGWWYSMPVGDRLKAMPQRTINHASSEVMKKKLAALQTDPELVRLSARELLGNANGVHLMIDKSIPSTMVNWLRISSQGSAVKDYAIWRDKILPDSFGPRKFVKMEIKADQVYQPS